MMAHVCATCPLWERTADVPGYGRCKADGPSLSLPPDHRRPAARGGWRLTADQEPACGRHPAVTAEILDTIDRLRKAPAAPPASAAPPANAAPKQKDNRR